MSHTLAFTKMTAVLRDAGAKYLAEPYTARVLLAIAEHEPRGACGRELYADLNNAGSTVRTSLSEAAGRGWITSVRRAGARARTYYLTAEGRAIVDEMLEQL